MNPQAQLMIPPPETLEELDLNVIEQNDLRLALPTITQNYKTYYQTKEKLLGLQNYINALKNKDLNNDN